MKFTDLPVNTIVVYLYNYSLYGLSFQISTIVIDELNRKCNKIIYSQKSGLHSTYVEIMDNDDRCTFIATVPSVDAAFILYPEYFI